MSNNAAKRARFFGLRALFSNWVISVGAIALLIFIAQYIDKLFFPGVVILVQLFLMRKCNSTASDTITSDLMPRVVARILFASVIIMVAINFYYLKFIDPLEFDEGTANPHIPYISALIFGPVSLIVTLATIKFRGKHISLGTEKLADKNVTEYGLTARIVVFETKFQLRMLMFVSIVVTAYAWLYYAFHYSNANMNRADRFYYNWVPVLLYIASLIYMIMRYWSIFAFCEKNTFSDCLPAPDATLLRFIVVKGDKVLLTHQNLNGKSVLDTPYSRRISATTRLDESQSARIFSQLTDIKPDSDQLRILYCTPRAAGHGNVFHIIVSLNDNDVINSSTDNDVWMTPYEISQQVAWGNIRPILGAEIHRVYTVAMTYKAYDCHGRRKYSIRHYKPLFKLDEIPHLDVDFNDPAWLVIADNNEDSRLFHVRRLWRKYVGGYEL